MHARIPLAICIATLFANTGLVHAQEGLVTLDSVVVIGERVQPEAVAKPLSVIDSDELSRRQASNLGETLRGGYLAYPQRDSDQTQAVQLFVGKTATGSRFCRTRLRPTMSLR